MKNSILLSALVVAAVVTFSILTSDGMTYIVVSIMALTTMILIRANKATVLQMTRWAKANPKKTQWLITGFQIVLMGLGVFSGKNLRELGFLFSDTTAYLFSALMIIGFLAVPFWPKRNTIAIPKVVNRQRFAYLGISLSCLILTAQIGNRIEDIFPNAPITHVIKIIDQSVFSDDIIQYLGYHEESTGQNNPIQSAQASTGGFGLFAVYTTPPGQGIKTINQIVLPDNTTSPNSLNKEAASRKEIRKATKEMRHNYRKSAAVVSSGAATILTFLLVILVCVGACLFFGGIAAILSGSIIGIVGIIAGPLILLGAVKGIKNLSKKERLTTSE